MLVALASFFTPRAQAQASSSPRLLHVRSCSSELACSALEARLTAELAALAVPLVELDVGAGELAVLAEHAQAVAAIRVTRDGTALELWQAQRDGPARQPASLQTISVDIDSGWSVSALSALEALRARLLASPHRDETARMVPPAESARPRPPPRLAPWLWLRAAIGAAYSPGGLGYHSQLLASLRLQPRSLFSASVFAALDLRSTTLRESEGAARVHATLTGMVVEVAPLARRHVTTALGAGLALAFLRVEGAAAEVGYAARSESIVGAGPVLRASAAAQLASWYLLRLELLAAFTTPRAALRFADREVATWGRPFLQLTLGSEFGLLQRTQT